MSNTNVHDQLYSSQSGYEIDLPSGGKATVKEMTGHDQRLFSNKAKMLSGMAIQELLANCTETVDGESLPDDKQERVKAVQNLLAGDRGALLFGIRLFSIGSDFTFNTECPKCQTKAQWEVDLSDKEQFPVKAYKLGKQKTIEYESKVRPGLKLQFTHLDGNTELEALKKRANIDLLTDLELRRVKAHNGHAFEVVQLGKVSNKLIDEMRSVIREYEGSVDDEVLVTCSNCGEDVVFHLLQQSDFMTPNVIS